MNPIALRKAKIVYNFGLSECTRVKRKTIVLAEDIKIIFFFFFFCCNVFVFFIYCQKLVYAFCEKKFSPKKSFLSTYPNFLGCNLNHTYFLFGLTYLRRNFGKF